MSHSNFGILYRELEKQRYATLPRDMDYVREREEIMCALGYGTVIKHVPNGVKAPKHHGKFVRRVRDMKMESKWGTTTDPKIKMEKKRIVNSVCIASEDLSKITSKIEQSMKLNHSIPDKLIDDLVLHNEHATKSLVKATSSPPKNKQQSVFSPLSTAVKLPTLQTPPVYKTRQMINSENKHVLVAQHNKSSKESLQKWSIAERERLNTLYLDMPLPTNRRNLELWKLYFYNIASRFIVFYPKRSIEEVTLKVQDMISKRQLKESGEIVYWRNGMPSI